MTDRQIDDSCPSLSDWATHWLSSERFSPYLGACGQDARRALELYTWNIGLGQVLMRDISYFEVALRNRYDAVMSECWGGSGRWLTDDSSPVRKPVMRASAQGALDVNRINRRIIDAAIAGLPKNYGAGSLVASISLGFWVHLSDRSREAVVWRTGLYRAWPKGTRRGELQLSLDAILRVRNRVAHNERLFNPKARELSPIAVDADLVRLFGRLCPDAAAYLYGSSGETPVELFLCDNPAPAQVVL